MIVQPSNRLMVVVSRRSLKLGNSFVNSRALDLWA